MSEIKTQVVYQFGLGGVGGFIVGFALKKIGKLYIGVIGLFILALLYLGINGVININYNSLWTTLANGLGLAGQAATWIAGIISVLPFVGSFAVGFLLGFKIG
jgi:uncharacterized membrane protein (Fun14 family)